jgi:hypothetical protein
LTAQNDAQRDAYNGSEPCLNSTTIGSSAPLSQIMQLNVDMDNLPSGYLSNPVYAQPLYISGITVSSPANTSNCNPSCNLAIGVTLNTTIFAWNATTGNVVWSREGGPAGTTSGTSGKALYYTDCGTTGSPVTMPAPHALPYLGILSTPVIDSSLSPPTMFLASYCKVPGTPPTDNWYLHGIDLTTGQDIVTSGGNPVGIQIPDCPASYGPNTGGWPTGSNGADGLSPNTTCTSGDNGAVRFFPANQNQRPALLEVGSLIYLSFGVHDAEGVYPASYPISSSSYAYHGWMMAYNRAISSSSQPTIAFATTAQGNSDGGQNSSSPNCDINTLTGTGEYQNQPNWCGHGGGIWMSGHGPAASNGTLADGYYHIFLGAGNGGYQQSGQNWGQSIIDFRESSSVTNTSPFQSFTPYGGLAIEPNSAWGACGCNSGGGSCGTTCSSFEVENANDWDMAVSGILLFDGSDGKRWAVSVDKGGYGYLLPQGNLCGGTPNPDLTQCNPQSYTSGDPGNQFAFQAPLIPCGSGSGPQGTDCDRVTGLASFYDGASQLLYFWPNTGNSSEAQERLTALQFNPGGAAITPPGSPTITTSGINVTGTGTYFTQWLIPGDSITAGGQTQVVTTITGDTSITATAFSPALSSSTALTSYGGYFVNPAPDYAPDSSTTGYPGGAVAVTSNSGSDGVVWAIIPAHVDAGLGSGNIASEYQRTQGYLWVYQATPVASNGSDDYPGLLKLWDSKNSTCDILGTGNPCATFCASPYAVPTVVQSMVFVSTYAINTDASGLCPTDDATQPSYNSGILVYGL